MKLRCVITADGDAEKILKLFAAEEKKLQRSSYTLKKTAKGVAFTITADDATALRATVFSITSILGMYEKTGEMAGKR